MVQTGEISPEYTIFNQRTAGYEAAHLLPHLEPGMRVVDCGCGAGSITLDLATAASPGEVVAFDISPNAIEQATNLAKERGITNVTWQVGDVYAPGIAEASFDAAHFCGVLCHLPDPGRALDVAYRLLKPGGVIALRDPYKGGDWMSGPFSEAIDELNRLIAAASAADGADPMVGIRYPRLLREAGFSDLELFPSYSRVFSQVANLAMAGRRSEDATFLNRIVSLGLATEEHVRGLAEPIRRWGESTDSLCGFAEITAIAWKREKAGSDDARANDWRRHDR